MVILTFLQLILSLFETTDGRFSDALERVVTVLVEVAMMNI